MTSGIYARGRVDPRKFRWVIGIAFVATIFIVIMVVFATVFVLAVWFIRRQNRPRNSFGPSSNGGPRERATAARAPTTTGPPTSTAWQAMTRAGPATVTAETGTATGTTVAREAVAVAAGNPGGSDSSGSSCGGGSSSSCGGGSSSD
jgi:hypothetical protein